MMQKLSKRHIVIALLIVAAAAAGFLAGALIIRARYGAADHPHKVVRWQAIQGQAKLFPKGQALIIGDSRVELSYIPSACGFTAFNAGIGGTKLHEWPERARELIDTLKPRVIIFALGVNDAQKGVETDPDAWRKSYRAMIDGRGEAKVILSDIFPTEDKATGRIFDEPMRQKLNQEISSLGGLARVEAPSAGAGLTYDGVHFSAKGQQLWRDALSQACSRTKIQAIGG